jgi:hypothetical protein
MSKIAKVGCGNYWLQAIFIGVSGFEISDSDGID